MISLGEKTQCGSEPCDPSDFHIPAIVGKILDVRGGGTELGGEWDLTFSRRRELDLRSQGGA
jgi:hypothetical protein